MRELDVLLLDYYETLYKASSERRKAAFQALLQLPDPQLIGYILGAQTPSNKEIAAVVDTIRNKAHP